MDHYFLRLFPRFVCFSVKKLCQSNDWVGSRGVLGIKPEQNCGGGGGISGEGKYFYEKLYW